jgi:hypothetical protein
MLRIVNVFSLFFLILFLATPGKLDAAGNYNDLRRNLIRQIIDDVRRTSLYLDKTALDEHVMIAMSSVPRSACFFLSCFWQLLENLMRQGITTTCAGI